MRILVLNCGSSSLKYDLFDLAADQNLGGGIVDRIGGEDSTHRYRRRTERFEKPSQVRNHAGAVQLALDTLMEKGMGVLTSPQELSAVAHRVVHGGDRFSGPVLIDDEVVAEIRRCIPLAPLHNPLNLAGIEAVTRVLPGVRQIAVFDTAFHHTLPPKAYLYGLPYEHFEKLRVRRYGFHGPSHSYLAQEAANVLGKPLDDLRLISCHLGNGASVCAVDRGRSIDTSMGLTPLEGLVMGTRSGDVDPAAVLWIQKEMGLTPDAMEALLNREAGLKGISGVSNDFRALLEAAEAGHDRALLAVQVYCYRLKKYIGAYAAVLGGVDALIFSGGVGENVPGVRARVCQGMNFLGLRIDETRNRTGTVDGQGYYDISAKDAAAKTLVIHTNEELMMAREAQRVLATENVTIRIRKKKGKSVPIGVSAHHVHLCREHLDALYGPGHELHPKTPLSQPGQFTCEETVDLVGPKGRVERVRVLGPLRKDCQIEISRTEEFKLGIDAPVRASGELHATPGITLEGPKGRVAVDHGVICALRHIHMNPSEAAEFGLRDKDRVRVRVEGKRPLTFGDVLIRVNKDYALDMHIDTDEANAAEVDTGGVGYLEGIQERASQE